MLYLGTDHGGYKLKEQLKHMLAKAKIPFIDIGARRLDPSDDYPPIAARVARAVTRDQGNRGILLCRSGVGVAVVANKVMGVRATVAPDPWLARRARRDDNINVLALPADRLTAAASWKIIRTFLATRFRNTTRDRRRIRQIKAIEHATR
ncbi:MAG: RpiB/LacA/LacB family sugar-phosphate isomerase [Candidatus Kerfeldbacteria bacterium]|nr:RpiB/LacA/LacB family sugar-phosphate isomerase [Candidatus Kerfeldbacteria bacterium]